MIEPTAAIFVQVPRSLRVRVKVAAARGNTTIAAVVSNALEAYLRDDGAGDVTEPR